MTEERKDFPEKVGVKEQRKLRAERGQKVGVWYGLGLFGVVGWSVAIPTLLGVLLGVWIDLTWPSARSWTIMLLVGGLGLGCVNAWLWISRQRRKILEEREREYSDDH